MTWGERPGPPSGGTARGGRGGPLRAVLAAFDAGAGDLGEVAERTGLDRGVVAAAVEHLVRGGQLQAERLSAGCPATGCSSCGSYTAPDPTSPGPTSPGPTAPDPTSSGPTSPGPTAPDPTSSGRETTARSGSCGGGAAPVEGRGPVIITITPRRGR